MFMEKKNTMDFALIIQNGLVVLEYLDEKARNGIEKEEDPRNIFYFFGNDYEIRYEEDFIVIEGKRATMFKAEEGVKYRNEALKKHGIPTKRFMSINSCLFDFFRKEKKYLTPYSTFVIPLFYKRKEIKIKFSKHICVQVNQDCWERRK